MHISKWIIKNIPEELLISISFVIIVDTKKKRKTLMNYMVVDIEREKKKNSIPYTNLLALSFLIVVIFFFSLSFSSNRKIQESWFFFHFTRPILVLLVVCLQGVIYFLYTKRVTFTKIKLY